MKSYDDQWTCNHCSKSFLRESSLLVHMCEQKRRHQERDEIGVNLGLQAYLRFYEITQGSSRLKSWDDFVTSAYYRAFVKFGRHCQSIRAVNIPRFTDWLIQHNKKIDHWCQDRVYLEYLLSYVRIENVSDALQRAIESGLEWGEKSGSPGHDFLRFGNVNSICYAITTGRVTGWILYNCDSGIELLSNLNQDHISMVWPWIESDFWQKKFQDYPADASYAREILTQAGW